MKRFMILVWLLFIIVIPNQVFGAAAMIHAGGLTGGSSDDLDAVECEDIVGDDTDRAIATGDRAMVVTTSGTYIYRYDATGTDSESSPDIIIPDDRATDCSGNGQWNLQGYSLDSLNDPNASKTFTMGAYTIKLTTSSDGAETLEIEDTASSHSSESVKFRIRADCLATDTNCVLLEILGDDDGDGDTVAKIVGSASDPPGWVFLGNLILNITSTNFDDIDDYKVDNVSLNDMDLGFTVEQTGVGMVHTGRIVGELDEIDDTAITSDDLTLAQCRGTLITNEGASAAVEYDLPTAEEGLHFKAICAEAYDVHFDADTSDKIYISDDDSISVTDDADQVQMDCANVGESMTCVTFSQDGSTWDWLCECGAGECTDDGAGT